MLGVVVDSHPGRLLGQDMPRADGVQVIARLFVVGTAYFEPQSFTRLQKNAVGPDLNAEQGAVAGNQRLARCVGIDRLPRRRCRLVQLML